jgi:2-polyprenyl-6-methoxyphenol hydroxylase-like FAD-dependent oxidoreductase
MDRPTHAEVLIAGAGAAGLTLAIELARRNVPVRLVDTAERPFIGSRGKGLQPRTQEVLEDLGVLNRMAAIGGPYPPTRSYGPGGYEDALMFERQPETPAIPYAEPLMLAQHLTEGVLRDRLAEFGVRPQFGCALTGFDQDEAGVEARLETPSGEERLRVSYLIGADGGRSFVRGALGIDFPGKTMPGRGLVADVALEGLERDVWHRWNPPGGMPLALCPLMGTDLFQLQGGVAIGEDDEPDLSDEALRAIVAERTGRADIVIGDVFWRSSFRLNARLADRYRVGRVFLAGDAAHVHPPTGGQGLNTSVQDAYALGWRLAAALAGAPDALLDTYEAERRPIAAEVLGLSTRLLDAGIAQGDMRRGRENHQIDLGYFDSSLVLERRSRSGRRPAGARAPDARLGGAGGQAVRLFEVMRGPQWTLLGYETARAGAPAPREGLAIHRIGADGELHDAHGDFAAAYDPDPGDWVLIRPDGYIGAIVAAGEGPALDAYLARLGLGA